MNKYQVWLHDSELLGHVYLEEDANQDEINASALHHAKYIWGNTLMQEDVTTCKISNSYYEDLARSSAIGIDWA